MDAVVFNAILDGCTLEKRRVYLDYRSSVEVEWDELRMETPFLNHDFVSGRVSGLPDGGPHYGSRIDGMGPQLELDRFNDVGIAWIAQYYYTLAEASEAMGENSGWRQTASGSCVTAGNTPSSKR